MKLQLIFFIALFVAVYADDYDGENDQILKARNKCYLEYETCLKKADGRLEKKLCYDKMRECGKKVAKEFKPIDPPKEGKEDEKDELDHSHHGHPHHGHHHGHHHRHRHHHHKKHHRMCPKHFCKCFKGLVGCIKRQHNKTMEEYQSDFPYADAEKYGYKEENVAMPPMAHVFREMANSDSKGNGTKACFKKFKACLKAKPGKTDDDENEFDDVNEMDLDNDDKDDEKEGFEIDEKDDEDNDDKRPMGPMKKWGKMGKKHGKMVGRKYSKSFGNKKPGFFTGAWNKMRQFGKKIAGKVKVFVGIQRRRHHHRHRRPHYPFARCVFFARMCKWRAAGSKQKMKECGKRFARCVLGICKRFEQ